MDIQFSQVQVRFPRRDRPLFRIDRLSIAAGSSVLIAGASGVGKTTLLHLMAGLFRPDGGDVLVGGHDLGRLSDAARSRFRRRHVGLVFQRLNLLDHLTAAENVRLALPPGPAGRTTAAQALERMALGALADQCCATMSMGEQQRVAVARVLAARPDLILADEPTSSLDQVNADAVVTALLEEAQGRTLVVVSHDPRLQGRFTRHLAFAELVAP